MPSASPNGRAPQSPAEIQAELAELRSHQSQLEQDRLATAGWQLYRRRLLRRRERELQQLMEQLRGGGPQRDQA